MNDMKSSDLEIPQPTPNIKQMTEEMVMKEARQIPFAETVALGIKWGNFMK